MRKIFQLFSKQCFGDFFPIDLHLPAQVSTWCGHRAIHSTACPNDWKNIWRWHFQPAPHQSKQSFLSFDVGRKRNPNSLDSSPCRACGIPGLGRMKLESTMLQFAILSPCRASCKICRFPFPLVLTMTMNPSSKWRNGLLFFLTFWFDT